LVAGGTMNKIKLEAVLIPKEVDREELPVCVLIDAVRASSTVAACFEQGASQILLTENEQQVLEKSEAIQKREGYCICAERVEGDKAELADMSPSLADVERFGPLNGKKVLFRTTNGTHGVHRLWKQGIREIYIGCMLNRSEVMKEAMLRAEALHTGLCVVCAGRENGNIYCIDDTYCAGKLLESAKKWAEKWGWELDLQDSAKLTLNMLDAYKDAEDAFSQSATGQIMRNVHSEIDIHLCSRDNISKVIPKVSGVDSLGCIIIDR